MMEFTSLPSLMCLAAENLCSVPHLLLHAMTLLVQRDCSG